MNYRHAFHAGNFADVLKHVFLARALVYLTKKETALRFIDTHAGVGRYDLTSDAARRSPEWRDGIARLLKARLPREVAELLRPYLKVVGAFDAEEGRPFSYPGSPAIAQALLRPQDRIALCETHDEEREKLVAALGHDARLSIVGTDGYVALNAYVPPKERRGLALVDPPYKFNRRSGPRRGNARQGAQKWPRGVYLLWRPIKDEREDRRFLNAIAALGVPGLLRLELDIGPIPPGPNSPSPLSRAGLLFVNPPYGLIDEARVLTPYLTKLLTRAGEGSHVCEWLRPPE